MNDGLYDQRSLHNARGTGSFEVGFVRLALELGHFHWRLCPTLGCLLYW